MLRIFWVKKLKSLIFLPYYMHVFFINFSMHITQNLKQIASVKVALKLIFRKKFLTKLGMRKRKSLKLCLITIVIAERALCWESVNSKNSHEIRFESLLSWYKYSGNRLEFRVLRASSMRVGVMKMFYAWLHL